MSWIDKIENTDFKITTGDGREYICLWKNGETKKEFNVATYDFINVAGSLIDRKKVRARNFPLTFWLQGADHLDQADAFDTSANDNRLWKVQHPEYGDIIGQPLSIGRNNTYKNVTEFTVDFWESISGVFPKASVSPVDQVADRWITVYGISPVDYSNKVILKPADVSTVTDLATKVNLLVSAAMDSIHYSDYQLLKNQMFAAVDDLILAPVAAIQAMYAVTRLPSQLATSFEIRFNLITAIYNSVKDVLGIKYNRNNKALFETLGCSCLASACLMLVNSAAGDFNTRNDVALATAAVTDMYNDYLTTVDAAYVPITDQVGNYSASTQTQTQLKTMITQTVTGMAIVAFNAKQERTVLLDRDSNLILLTHKYMGLDAADANLETFRTINGIKNKKLFGVRAGTRIKYYV